MGWPIIQIATLLYGAYRYFTKPKPKSTVYKGGSIEVTATTNTPVPVCYGNCEVTGNIIYKEDTTSATNDLAVGLCEGPIQSIESVTVNGVSIPVYPTEYEGCSYTPHYGTAAQTADSRFSTSLMRVTCCENNYVDEEYPAVVQNYYSTDRLLVYDSQATGLEKYVFLKFDISSINLTASSDISAATLRLTVPSNSATANHTLYIYEMTDDSWDESTITWNNKPGFGDQITTLAGSLIVAANSVYCDINITQWVKDTYDYDASKIVGIGIKLDTASSGAAQVTISSRDSAGAPELRIAYAPKELAAFAHTAYVAMTIKDSELFKGHVNDIKVRLHGREIYDGDVNPNYSTNPAWCVYDQLTNSRYGADIPTSLINESSFTSVASYCDTSITNEDGISETRARCDVVFDDKDTVGNRINDILASFGGYLYMVDGKLNIGVDSTGSSSHTFTVDNIVDGSFNYWLIDKSQQPNDISVMYYDAANDFKASYVNVKDQTLIDTYGRNFEEIQLRCINRYSQASRMAKYYLNKSSYSQYGCSFKVSINNCDVAPGDICTITHAVAGWTSETFRIVSVQEDDNDEIVVTCEEYDAALYSDDGLPYTPPEGGSLPNVNEVPPIVTGLTLTETHAQGDDGTYIPQIKVTFTVPDYIFPLNYIVWYKLHADPDYIFWEMSTDNLAYINTDGAGQYDVVVQTVNILTGLKTDFGTSPSDTITLAGKTTPPGDVSFNDTNSKYYLEVYIEWLPVSDTDLAFYELRTDTNWGNPTNLIWQGKATSYILSNPAATSYTFYIKARDLSDNYSTNADSITLTKADPVLGTITTNFTGQDCFLTWEHTEDKDFVMYVVRVYSDAARTALIRAERIGSPPYIYTYDNNKSDNSGTPIRHPYFTILKLGTLAQSVSQNCDAENTAPTAPTGLTLTPGMGKLFMTWDAWAQSDLWGYNVYADTTNPPTTKRAFVTAAAYTFDPEAENTYYVQIAAVDAFGEGTKCSVVSNTTNPYALTNYNLDVPITAGINYSVAAGKVTWTTGKLWYEDAEHTIAAEVTGKSTGYIYWDKDSPTVFQHSATPPALDDDVWVMAYFDGTDVSAAFAQKIIHGGLIQASSITADKMSVTSLSAISATLGTVTSGTMQSAASGQRVVIDGSTNTLKFITSTGVEAVKIDDNINASGAAGIQISSAVGGRVYLYDTDDANNTNVISQNGIAINTTAGGSPVNITQHTSDLDDGVIRINYTPHDQGIFIQCDNDGDINFEVYADGDVKTAGDIILEKGTNDVTITATAPAAARTYTIPDAGANDSFVLTAAVARGDIITGQGATPSWEKLTVGTAGQYLKSDGTDVSWAAVTATAGGSDTQLQYNNSGALAGTSDLTYDGTNLHIKSNLLLYASNNTDYVQYGTQVQTTGSCVCVIPDLNSTSAFFVMSKADQTIAGIKTFSSFPVTPSSAPTTDYQVANKKYVDDAVGVTPGGSDTQVQYNNGGAFGGNSGFTFDDVTGKVTATLLESTSNITTGDKLVFNRTNDVTIDAANPAAIRTYTIPDTGANDYFVLTAAVARGDIITGQGATPTWEKLAVGTKGQYLKTDGTDVSWGALTPAGSSGYVQYNGDGALDGESAFTYNDTTHQLNIDYSILAGNETSFDTSSTDARQDGLLLTSNQDLGAGNLGASVAFTKHNAPTVRSAAIVAKQITSDSDQVGLSIYTHPSSTSSNPLVEAIEIDHNGNIHLMNGATVFKEISVSLLSCKLRGTADPTLSQIANATGPTTGVYAYNFPTSATKEVFGSIQIPQDYKAASSLYVHVNRRFDGADPATTDNVRIGLEYNWTEEDGTMGSTTTVEVEGDIGADYDTKLIRHEIATITGTAHAAGSTLLFRLYRETALANEADAGMWITSIDFEYESDRLGADATTV